jgi:hypothetical protein
MGTDVESVVVAGTEIGVNLFQVSSDFFLIARIWDSARVKKVRNREDALASTRDACTTRERKFSELNENLATGVRLRCYFSLNAEKAQTFCGGVPCHRNNLHTLYSRIRGTKRGDPSFSHE